ncbi:MAG: DNA-processing protein DprA [Candidatus Coatesbacteria bacterium]
MTHSPAAGIPAVCLALNAAGITLRRLTEAGVSPPELPDGLDRIPLLPRERALLAELDRTGFGARELDEAGKRGWTTVDVTSPAYPERLRQIPDPPLALYVRGDPAWLSRPAIGIVGSRMATLYGRSVAEALASQLALRGLVIVSGFARGIDGAAHRAAIRAGGGTVAVLGTGLTVDYPHGHEALREQVAAHGCLVSEFPLAMGPRKENFPRRNRIISGLSLGIVVVEAHEISGALITARHASEQGREVFAVPGNVFAPSSRGPHRLLKDGARLTESAEDILTELAGVFVPQPLASGGTAPAAGTLEATVYAALTPEPVQADDLARRLGLPIATLLPVLSVLELKRCARPHPGKRFSLA